ncbi:MAG: spermidine/putrescine ABC transporter substrate-binding protein [Acidimicrobiaceae bacterium]|nr:spermidine/putrescine ABC transporter substrate-binding protein [Acidimicrobiaceae bacterium]
MNTSTTSRRSGTTRRQFLAGTGALGALGLSLPALLAACGGGDSGGADSLFFENWPLYIDPTEGATLGTVDRFMEATGVKMTYTEAYNDNNEYFAKIQPLLGAGKSIEPDVIAPTFWLAGRLLALGWLEKLPLDKIPNAVNLEPSMQNPTWDPTGEYSLPWQAGMAGVAYNIDVTGRELKSVEDLFDPAFKGKIGMLTEMRDTIGLIMLGLGKDPSTVTSFDDAAGAFDKLDKAKSDGQIRAFTGNDYTDDLVSGNFAACVGWSGDVLQLQKDSPHVRFVIPEEGGTSWADVMVVPKGAKNTDAVAKWMNFVYDPAQAAQLSAYVQYVSPVKGVQEELAKIDPDLAANPLMFPDETTSARLRSWATLTEEVEAEFDAAFSRITGA